MSRNIYLAGPFFNALEVDTIEKIEKAADQPHVKCFSPRNCGGNADRQSDVKANAQMIFDANVRAMRECHECIAVLDRRHSPGQQVWLVENLSDQLQPVAGPLEQPDLGTVWELGYLMAWRNMVRDLDVDLTIPSIWTGQKVLAGFTLKPRGEKVKQNVMLARCLDLVLHGWEELVWWLTFSNASIALEEFKCADLVNKEGDVE